MIFSSLLFLSVQEISECNCLLFSSFPKITDNAVCCGHCFSSPRFEKMTPPRLRSVGLHRVYFQDVNLSVTVTRRAAEVDRWVKKTLYNHRRHLHYLIVGLDIEWHPCLEGEDNPAATLQLCVGRSCLIFQLLHKDYVPDSLHAFLGNPIFTFVGVGVQDDAEKLLRDHGLIARNVVDLRHLAARVYGFEDYFSRMGLKRMALEVLGREMEKPREVTLSHWDSKHLSPSIKFSMDP